MMLSLGSRKVFAAASLASVLLLCASFVPRVRADFYAAPSLKWSLQLEGSGKNSSRGLRKGNAIVVSKDGTKIVVTADDGSLHFIQTTNLVKTLSVFQPDGIVGRNMECRSGATIVYKNQQDGLFSPAVVADFDEDEKSEVLAKEDFALYSVIDRSIMPASTEELITIDGTTSRLFAVSMDGDFRWSVDLPGIVEGNPVVGKTGIYVTHNANGMGYLSVLKIHPSGGKVVVVASVSTPAASRGRSIPLSAPALRNPPSWENERESPEDLVVVAENWGSPFTETRGSLYMLSSSTNGFSDNEKGGKDNEKGGETAAADAASGQLRLLMISPWSVSASAAPMVYGDSIYVGAAGGILGGFTGDRKNDLSGITSGREEEITPRWNYQVSQNTENASEPIRNQPVLDSEGDYLVVVGMGTDVHCIQSDNGRELWRDEEGSQVLAKPYVFEGEDWRKVVYAIETQNGRVRQYDLYTGRRYWDYSCADISTQFCQDAVEADFAVTPSGNIIYYGDVHGRINSLQVADFVTETPTIAPTETPSESPTGTPTVTPVPTGVPSEKTTESAIVPVATTSSPVSANGTPSGWILINGDKIDEDEGSDEEGSDDDESVGTADATTNTETSAISDQQSSKKVDSNMISAYIGVAIAALCLLMIPIVVFSLLRRRKRGNSGKMQLIDDVSSDDLESQDDMNRFRSIETNDTYEANNEDGIEVEIVNRPVRGTPSKKKKRKKKKGLPDTPDTVNTLDSIEELPEDASAMVVVETESNIANPSVEAVNLRKSFDMAVDSRGAAAGGVRMGAGSNHLELSTGIEDSFYSDDDDVPPPPPLPEESKEPSPSKNWTWGSLMQIGKSQSSSKLGGPSQDKPREKLELKQSKRSVAQSTPPVMANKTPSSKSIISAESHEDVPTDERPPVQDEDVASIPADNEINESHSSYESEGNDHPDTSTSLNTSRSTDQNENSFVSYDSDSKATSAADESAIMVSESLEEASQELADQPAVTFSDEETEENEETGAGAHRSVTPQQNPISPTTYSMLSDAVQAMSPAQSIRSIHETLFNSPQQHSEGSDDDSLYTSYTGTTTGTREKKKESKDLSPLSNYVYDQDIHRRGRSEIVNEGKRSLAQPDLSRRPYARRISEEEHPDDESAAAPGMHYMKKNSQDTDGPKYGRSVRSKRDVNSFKETNSVANGSGHTPLAEMYDQLAAIGQQRREEKKPAFKRRNKRAERYNPSPPTPEPEPEEQQGDTWGSFLKELDEAEEQFFSPSANKNKSLLNEGGSEDGEDAELARINDLYNY